MGQTGIEWTDKTWNPVVGCRRISEGCRHCYAKTLHDQRHKAFKEGKKVPAQYAKPFEQVQLMPDRLRDPLSWRKPCRVFVNSVSDLFHEDVNFEFIDRVFTTMALAKQHTFQVLTKRPERMREYFAGYRKSPVMPSLGVTFKDLPPDDICREGGTLIAPLPNVWLGVSVENQAAADERIPHLLATPAAVRFLSCEPLLGPVDLEEIRIPLAGESFMTRSALHGTDGLNKGKETPGRDKRIDWCIVGGESGPGSRPMHVEWARSLVRQCEAASVACFVKQLGSCASDPVNGLAGAALAVPEEAAPLVSLRLKDKKGGDPSEWPSDLQVREFPATD
jgi:protein gp37